MAGKGLRLVDAGFEKPKPLVEIKNKTIMEWSINSLNLDEKFIFCTKQEHIEKFEIDSKLREIINDCEIVPISYDTHGTVDTILNARKLIDNDEELLITDADHYVEWDHEFFNQNIRKRDIDGCTMVYPKPKINEAMIKKIYHYNLINHIFFTVYYFIKIKKNIKFNISNEKNCIFGK